MKWFFGGKGDGSGVKRRGKGSGLEQYAEEIDAMDAHRLQLEESWQVNTIKYKQWLSSAFRYVILFSVILAGLCYMYVTLKLRAHPGTSYHEHLDTLILPCVFVVVCSALLVCIAIFAYRWWSKHLTSRLIASEVEIASYVRKRQELIDEAKQSLSFNETLKLLERYDEKQQGTGTSGTATPGGESIASTPLRQRTQRTLKHTETPTEITHTNKPTVSSVLDRMVGSLVGDMAPEQCYALICGQCYTHNGLALPEKVHKTTFRCCHCDALNQPAPSEAVPEESKENVTEQTTDESS